LNVTPEAEVLFTTFAWMLIGPVLSTNTLPLAMAVTRLLFRMFAVPVVFDSNTPLMKVPSVLPDAVMLTIDAVWLGVIVMVVPTKASEVNVRDLAPTPTFEVNPRSVNVATPWTVLTVTEVTAVPEVPTLSTWPVAVTVTSCSAEPSPAVTWIGCEKLLPARVAVAVRVTSRFGP
jgi:hypothetical protein